MNMKKTILVLSVSVMAAMAASAQNREISGSFAEVSDTVAAADTIQMAVETYMSYDSLMTYLGSQVQQSDSLAKSMRNQLEKNKGRRAQGYRIRIYFDNSQNARTVSEQIVDTFKVHYPGVPVFRIYDNPYFKVTVGWFRAKSDAMRFMEAIRREYPTVFLVKESSSTI